MRDIESILGWPIPHLYDEGELESALPEDILDNLSGVTVSEFTGNPSDVWFGDAPWVGVGLYSRCFGFVTQNGTVTGLALTHAGFEDVPASLFRLPQLRSLFLNYNHISQVPDALGKLSHLENMEIEGNPISCITETIENLKNLRSLNIIGTDLVPLPTSLLQLQSLEKIKLDASLPRNDPVLTSLLGRGVHIHTRFRQDNHATLEEAKPVILDYLRAHPSCKLHLLQYAVNIDASTAHQAVSELQQEGLI